MFIVIKENA